MKSEIKLDMDEKNKSFFEDLALLSRFFNFRIKGIKAVKTRHGKHVRIWIDRVFEPEDIVFFQIFLGSDKKRELFNWLRVRSGCERWNVLFKEKYKFKKGKLELLSEEE